MFHVENGFVIVAMILSHPDILLVQTQGNERIKNLGQVREITRCDVTLLRQIN